VTQVPHAREHKYCGLVKVFPQGLHARVHKSAQSVC